MTDSFFVTCKDGPKTGYLLGPFTTEKACMVFAQYPEDNPDSRLIEVKDACADLDRKSVFFSWGMCRIRDFIPGEIVGVLNRINPEKWDKVLS